MEDIILPKPIKYTEESETRARFAIEPLNPGYGMTLGNSLRRILLSSLPGCAITAVSLPTVAHEFSSLEHVKEDVVEIALNLKQVRFRVVGEHVWPIKIEIERQGEGKVSAGEFSMPTGVDIVTPELILATLTHPKANFSMTAYVNRGRGFNAVEAREKEYLELGTISIDALYSPVRHVAFSTENVRVGQMTNYDKINLVVETDGSMSPRAAFLESVNILREQATALILEDMSGSETTLPDATPSGVETMPEPSVLKNPRATSEDGGDDVRGEEKKGKRGRKKAK